MGFILTEKIYIGSPANMTQPFQAKRDRIF